MTSWTFGESGSGLYFTIIYEGGELQVNMLEGSMDLNALWFSDGDALKEGDTTLTKKEGSLNMNGAGAYDADGNLITWDDVEVLSLSGLGKEGVSKDAFLTAGETYALDASLLGAYDLANLLIGVRATSVNGGSSIKLVSESEETVSGPTVDVGQSFNYTENRKADSFIGSVDASGDNGVSSYRFWDPVSQTYSQTSPDGFFTIDDEGKIWLTAAGAASYANNAEDEQGADGPDNTHQYFVQAGDADGNWSAPVEITLNEGNCACDDGLPFLINLNATGEHYREINAGGVVYEKDADWNLVEVDQADPGEAVISMVSTGRVELGLDEWDNPIVDYGRAVLKINTLGNDNLLSDVTCLRLDAVDSASATMYVKPDVVDGALVTTDKFMDSLEKISIRSSESTAYLGLYADSSTNYMSALKDISMDGARGASLTVSAQVGRGVELYDADWNLTGIANPAAGTGDRLMQSLETIHMTSGGSAQANISDTGGSHFMTALSSITMNAKDDAKVELLTGVRTTTDINGQPLDTFTSEDFASALEVISVHSDTRGATLNLYNDAADNYLASLSTINLDGNYRETLRFDNEGGDNYVSGVKAIDFSNGEQDVRLYLENEQLTDESGTLHAGASFMTALETLNVSINGDVDIFMSNGDSYDHDGDWQTPDTFGKSGAAYLDSLKSIDVDAGTGGIEFEFLNAAQDAETLGSLTSLTLTGGRIEARFSTYMENEAWFDFANIQGSANGTEDQTYLWSDALDDLTVLGGFDTTLADDYLSFGGGLGILSVDDLVITTEGNNVRIGFDPSLGYDGSVVLLGVAADFDAAVNLQFAGW